MTEKDTMKKFLQKQPYRITIARHKLGIHQCRIMVRVVEQLQPYMHMEEIDHTSEVEDVWVTIKVSELVLQGNYKPLQEALNSLKSKKECVMHFIEEKATILEIGTNLIQAYKYEHGAEEVKVQISGHLLPQMVSLARGYTKYSVDVAFQTSSPNVFKLYQFIAHFRDKKQIELKVKTLREWLRIETKYDKPAEIVRRILNPAMQELKEKADVWFEIAQRVTEGRRMIGWKFNIYTKPGMRKIKPPVASVLSEEKTVPKAPSYAPVINGSSSPSTTKTPLTETLSKDFQLSEWQAKKIVNKVPEKEIHRTLYDIRLASQDKRIKSLGGYTAQVFDQKFNLGMIR